MSKLTVLAVVLAALNLLAQTAAPPSGPANPSAPASAPPSSPKPDPGIVAPAVAPVASSPVAASDDAVPVQHHKSHKPTPPPPVVLPPLPKGPLSQMPMDQIPPTPAKVTYQGGLLTISAQNATLGEILRDVRKLTGASIEFPSGSNGSSEHVVTHLGPGTPRDVMVSLLNGSSFNYVMIGSNLDPAVVASVILTPKDGGAGDVANATQTAANVYQNSPGGAVPPGRFPGAGPRAFNPGNGPQPAPAAADDSNDDQDTAEDNTDDQSQPTQQVAPAPDPTDASAISNGQTQPADPNQPNAGPKTPEQILDMLRRGQQQQPGAAGNNPPPPQQQ